VAAHGVIGRAGCSLTKSLKRTSYTDEHYARTEAILYLFQRQGSGATKLRRLQTDPGVERRVGLAGVRWVDSTRPPVDLTSRYTDRECRFD
jgi:hypothetical protein